MRPALVMIHVGIGLFAVVLGIVGWTLYDFRQSARNQAEQAANNLALGLERDVDRAVDTLDLSIRAAVQGMAIPGIAAMGPALRQAILFDGSIASRGFGGLSITDEDGRIIYDSFGPMRRLVTMTDRDDFKAHQRHADLGLIISRPLRNHTDGQWVLALSRRISHPDGSFAGVVVGELRVSYFDSLFDLLAVGAHGGVGLFGTGGWLITRWPANVHSVGADVSHMPVFVRMMEAPDGTFEARANADDIQRIYAYRRVGSLPLILCVGLATEDVFAVWNHRSLVFAAALLVLCGLGAGLAWALHKEVQRQHALALARLNALFQNSADAMFVARVNADGSFCYEDVNPVWEEMAGISAAAAVGRDPRECWPPETADEILAGWRVCLGERRGATYACTLDHAGDARDWDVVVAPVLAERGGPRRLIGVGRDNTQRNRLEAQLRQSHRLEAVGQLTAGIAHDFNNLLQAILGSLEILQAQAALDEEGGACIGVAARAARRGASLVHRLLAFSRKQALDPAPLRPADVLGTLAELLTYSLGGRVRIDIEVDPDCWPVHADATQLEDCLCDLALNARDAMPHGGVMTVRVGNATQAAAEAAGLAAGEYVHFTVEDEGGGMSPEMAARAQEPFFTTKAVGAGTGLGLSMVQGFARQSGGDIRIDSVVGRGTTVTLWLPRAAPLPSTALPGRCSQPGGAGPPRVLVVDDEAMVRQTLSLFLRKAGLNPVVVESAQDALALLQAGEACDLLVTDQSMPEMSGSELIEQTLRMWPAMPVMLITGYDRVGDAGGPQSHITVLRKPFARSAFLEAVRSLLGPAAPQQRAA